MRLYLENIGKIRTADIKINGITVIAGENDTGKSTVGKALYSFFRSFHDFEQKTKDERTEAIERIFINAIRKAVDALNYDRFQTGFSLFDIADAIISFIEVNSVENFTLEKLKTIVDSTADDSVTEDDILYNIDYSDVHNRIIPVMNITSTELSRVIFAKILQAEFNGQINNIFYSAPGKILLEIAGKKYTGIIKDNKVESVSEIINLYTDVVYIDDPYILDDIYRPSYGPFYLTKKIYNHRQDLKAKLESSDSKQNFIDEVIAGKKLDEIMRTLDTVCSGQIVYRPERTGYSKGDSDKSIDVRNLSMGLKTFVILKTLILNGIIEEKGTVIMDEPEIHLHPDWQIKLADLIVQIQKEFKLHILMTTHSPYFLHAIEVFSGIHGTADRCSYYLASNDENEYAIITEVTDSIDEIYQKLARPFQDLENLRYKND